MVLDGHSSGWPTSTACRSWTSPTTPVGRPRSPSCVRRRQLEHGDGRPYVLVSVPVAA